MSYSINENCIGCTLCAKNCPVKAISGGLKERQTIDPERCISCGLCGRLCAKGAVTDDKGNTAQRLDKAKWLRPVIDSAACTGCSMCVEGCPAYCLALTEPARHGDIRTYSALSDESKCIGCGICSRSCPIGAITMK